jgi:hypothetical protein
MSTSRRSIHDDVEPLDTTDFQAKPSRERVGPPPEQIRAISEAANFPDRESLKASSPVTKRKGRQYTTGRNIGFACKATQKTYDTIYEIAEQEQWKVAEVLEHAIAALQRELLKR